MPVTEKMTSGEASNSDRKLEPGDLVEGLEEPVLDEKTGATRVKAHREVDVCAWQFVGAFLYNTMLVCGACLVLDSYTLSKDGSLGTWEIS